MRLQPRLLLLLSVCFGIAALVCSRPTLRAEALTYQRPLESYLQATSPASQVQVLRENPTRLLVTTESDPDRLRQDLSELLSQDQLMVVRAGAAWHPTPANFWMGALLCALLPVGQLARRAASADWRKALARLRGQVDPRGLRQACIILASFPAEFRSHCLDQLSPQQRQALNIPLRELSKVSYAESQRVMVAFKVEVAHRRRKLGRAGETSDPDYHLVAQILREGYLAGGPGPEPVSESKPLRARVTRRRIYICPQCDEPFVVEEEFKRHEATHLPPAPRFPSLKKSGAALLLLAGLTALHQWSPPTPRIKFPQARALSTREQVVVEEARKILGSDLIVCEGRNRLVLLCDASQRPVLESLVHSSSPDSILVSTTSSNPWVRLAWLECLLGLTMIAAARVVQLTGR